MADLCTNSKDEDTITKRGNVATNTLPCKICMGRVRVVKVFVNLGVSICLDTSKTLAQQRVDSLYYPKFFHVSKIDLDRSRLYLYKSGCLSVDKYYGSITGNDEPLLQLMVLRSRTRVYLCPGTRPRHVTGTGLTLRIMHH
jgi:hypothetical protein